MAAEQLLTLELIRLLIQEQLERLQPPGIPELLTIQETAELCRCDKSLILELVNDPASDFPAIRLGPRTIRVDKVRLLKWLAKGGKNGICNKNFAAALEN